MSPPEQPVPTFEVSEEHKEVVVISGEVRCLNSREKLTAPCIVPRNVRGAGKREGRGGREERGKGEEEGRRGGGGRRKGGEGEGRGGREERGRGKEEGRKGGGGK